MPIKKCFKCGEEKPLHAFYRHAMMRDGHLNKCVACTRKDVGEHRAKNLGKIQEYDRQRASLPHRREMAKRVMQRYKQEHPERRTAHILLGNAVRTGKVQPWPCMICGEKAEAHHPCYDMPLDVVWLCHSHHVQAHQIARVAA